MSRTAGLIESLSEREIEVLRLIAAGRTNPEIAQTLNIKLATAKRYVSEVLQKLQVPTREEAAAHYHLSERPSARLGRTFAAIPVLWRWTAVGATGALLAAAVAVGIFVARAPGPVAGERWLVAYVDPDLPTSEPLPHALDVVDLVSGDSWEIGPLRAYRSVQWSPAGDRLLAVTGAGELLLLTFPDGEMIAVEDPAVELVLSHGNSTTAQRPTWSPTGSSFVVAGRMYDNNGHVARRFDESDRTILGWSIGGTYYSAVNPETFAVFDRAHQPIYEASSDALRPGFWISDTHLAVKLAPISGVDQFAALDFAASPPTLGPPEPAEQFEERVFADLWAKLEAAGERVRASGLEFNQWHTILDLSERAWLSASADGVGVRRDPGPHAVTVIATNGSEEHIGEILVRWTVPTTGGLWGPVADLVILD